MANIWYISVISYKNGYFNAALIYIVIESLFIFPWKELSWFPAFVHQSGLKTMDECAFCLFLPKTPNLLKSPICNRCPVNRLVFNCFYCKCYFATITFDNSILPSLYRNFIVWICKTKNSILWIWKLKLLVASWRRIQFHQGLF